MLLNMYLAICFTAKMCVCLCESVGIGSFVSIYTVFTVCVLIYRLGSNLVQILFVEFCFSTAFTIHFLLVLF